MVNKDKVEALIKQLLIELNEDPNREGLSDTPHRVAKMWEEVLRGYDEDPKEYLARTFTSQGSDMVVEKNIEFASTCEHHLMPFFGVVHIAYIPNGKVVGLSKLARTVDAFARRLQIQEDLTNEIANAIFENLQPLGVCVMVEAEHTCMTVRGVKKYGSKTGTLCTLGEFGEANMQRFLALIK